MHRANNEDELAALLEPAAVLTRVEVLMRRPCPVPAVSGVYAWYFDQAPPSVPTQGCHYTAAGTLLYVGISPKAPPKDGRAGSRQTLRSRIRYHFRGNAYGSTLRLSLGSLLSQQLGIQLRRVGSGQRLTFADDEAVLSEWMARHARVCWVATSTPWLLESQLIHGVRLPLNLDQNKHSVFHAELTAARANQRTKARGLSVG